MKVKYSQSQETDTNLRFYLGPKIMDELARNFRHILYDAQYVMPDGTIIKISPFTDHLRALGADLSEESTSRYLRFLKDWKWGAVAIALGKSKYQVRKY